MFKYLIYLNFFMTKMIVVLVEVIIFTSVIGIIATLLTAENNLTGAAKVLYGLVGLFVVIGFILGLLKQMGLKTGR